MPDGKGSGLRNQFHLPENFYDTPVERGDFIHGFQDIAYDAATDTYVAATGEAKVKYPARSASATSPVSCDSH